MTAQKTICFAADRTLGKLVKWLRLLGFDAVYPPAGCRVELFFQAQAPSRTLLTRTKAIARGLAGRNVFFIHSNAPFEQLAEIVRAMPIKPENLRPFTRCLKCNLPLDSATKAVLAGRVPDYIWHSQQHFCQCRGCGRVFWPGSHKDRSLDRILTLCGDGWLNTRP
jgi:uncharacterized protein with PIN domain